MYTVCILYITDDVGTSTKLLCFAIINNKNNIMTMSRHSLVLDGNYSNGETIL